MFGLQTNATVILAHLVVWAKHSKVQNRSERAAAGVLRARGSAGDRLGRPFDRQNVEAPRPCGWKSEIQKSHHLETMVESIVCWYLQGNRILPGFLRWCEMDFATIHSGSKHVARVAIGWAKATLAASTRH